MGASNILDDPELQRYMEKRVSIKLTGKRRVSGIVRGFDPFMNIVLEEAVEEVSPDERNDMGLIVIRGNSIRLIEPLEPILL